MPLVVFACRGLSSLPGHYTRSLFDGKFRGFAANFAAFMAKCRFFGGRLATIFSLCNPGAGAATKWRKR